MTIYTALHKIAQAEADLDERLKVLVKNPEHRLDIVAAISELITAKIEAEQTRTNLIPRLKEYDPGDPF